MLCISMRFISLFLLIVICLAIVPFYPQWHTVVDSLIQMIFLVTIGMYMRHWNENLRIYIKNKFTVMLTTKSKENRLQFTSRCISLAKTISARCKDEIEATDFLNEMKSYCVQVYEQEKPLTLTEINRWKTRSGPHRSTRSTPSTSTAVSLSLIHI